MIRIIFWALKKSFIILLIIVALQAVFNTVSIKKGLTQATVIRVIDGDTILVNQFGEEKTVRLIGIDAPESVNPDESKNCKEGREASAYLKEKLSQGDIVYLQMDQTDMDSYGRSLRYVWLQRPKNFQSGSLNNYCLNAIILNDGYAKAKKYPPNTRFSEYFELMEGYARESQFGLWEQSQSW